MIDLRDTAKGDWRQSISAREKASSFCAIFSKFQSWVLDKL
jgi:hypothetical protein